MKNIYKIFIAIVMLTGLWSCENEENLMILEPQEAAFAIITPDAGSSTILNKETPNNTALTVTWEKVSYGAPTIVTYALQFAKADTEFAVPVDIASSTSTHATVTVAELNAKALEFGLKAGEEGAIEVRIKSTVGTTGSEPKFSDVITIVVTPYEGVTPAVDLYLIGPGTAAGWSVTDNLMPIFRDPRDNAKHYYTGYLNKDGFKLIQQVGQWAPAYGTNGDKVQFRATESNPDPGVFPTSASGYYSFEISIKDLTYKIAPYTGPTAVNSEISYSGDVIPGAGDGWAKNIALTKSTFDPHIWKASGQTLNAGKMKFHTSGWAKEWGDNGGDIIVEAGKYDIWLNDLDGRYMFIKVQ